MENFFLQNLPFFIFLILLTILLIYKKKNLKIEGGKFPYLYILIYETKIGIKWMKNLANKYPKTIKGFAWASFIIGLSEFFYH